MAESIECSMPQLHLESSGKRFAPLLQRRGETGYSAGTTVQDRRRHQRLLHKSELHGNLSRANYALAKAGVLGLTKTVAKGEALRVRCNAVAFGMVETADDPPSPDADDSAADDDAPPQGLPPDVAAMWKLAENAEDGGAAAAGTRTRLLGLF